MGIYGISALYDEKSLGSKGTIMTDTSPDHHDDEDVPAILSNTDTSNESGFENSDELPASDFVAFAEPDVETEQ